MYSRVVTPLGKQVDAHHDEMEHLEEEVDSARAEVEKDERMLKVAQKMLRLPDGNIYRGWAIGIQADRRQLPLTCVVIFIQILAPLFLHFWASRNFEDYRYEYIWQHWANVLNKNLNTTASNNVTATPTITQFQLRDIWECKEVFQDVQLKILGVLFMWVIFFSNDGLLLRADLQSDKMRWLFPEGTLSQKWMRIDAFVNSWCIALIGAATLPLFWGSDNVSELILDSFGLLFLARLDDYSADLEHGFDNSDFDDVMDHVGKRRTKQDDDHAQKVHDPNDEWVEIEWTWDIWFHERFCSGDFFYSISRIANGVYICFFPVAFFMFTMEKCNTPSTQTPSAACTRPIKKALHSEGGLVCILIGLFMWMAWFLFRACVFLRAEPDDSSHPRSRERVETVGLDGGMTSFFYIVCLRRHDPRYRIIDRYEDSENNDLSG